MRVGGAGIHHVPDARLIELSGRSRLSARRRAERPSAQAAYRDSCASCDNSYYSASDDEIRRAELAAAREAGSNLQTGLRRRDTLSAHIVLKLAAQTCYLGVAGSPGPEQPQR